MFQFQSKFNFVFLVIMIALLTSTTSCRRFDADQIIGQPFDVAQCLNTPLSTEVTHKGKMWGMVKQTLKLTKDKCVINIGYKVIFSDHWTIDVCRAPAHIKINKKGGDVEILKRKGICNKPDDDDSNATMFCKGRTKLLSILQDDGLIFAEGEKEDITSSHGQTFCMYNLIQRYLDQGVIFYRNDGHLTAPTPVPSVTPTTPSPVTTTAPETKRNTSP